MVIENPRRPLHVEPEGPAVDHAVADPERYDRTRPRYPEALVDRTLAGSPGSDILDVGCGTGIEARQFQAAGGRVLGVEPRRTES